MTLIADSHKLTQPALVDLYSVDLNSIGVGEVYHFYQGIDAGWYVEDGYWDADYTADYGMVTYQGNIYTPWPMKITGIDKRGTGSSARPSVELSNYQHFITDLCRQYQDMVGATVRRRRTLSSYIAGNIAEYTDDYYLVEQRVGESLETVKFDLSSPMDFLDKQLPGVIAIATGCPHRYKSTLGGSGCSWPGVNPALWFDRFGTPVLSESLDVCGKRLTDCKLRFGANNPLDYGGNPGLGRSST